MRQYTSLLLCQQGREIKKNCERKRQKWGRAGNFPSQNCARGRKKRERERGKRERNFSRALSVEKRGRYVLCCLERQQQIYSQVLLRIAVLLFPREKKKTLFLRVFSFSVTRDRSNGFENGGNFSAWNCRSPETRSPEANSEKQIVPPHWREYDWFLYVP